MNTTDRAWGKVMGGIGLAAFLNLSIAALASAQIVPPLLNFQGRLTTPSGQPMATSEYVLAFRIYDAPSGGTLKWGPQLFDGESGAGHGAKVPVVQGHFNVILGPSDVDGHSLVTAFTAPDRWMEITVGDGSPILPRQQVLSTPFALTAGTGGGAVGDVVASVLNELQFNQVHPVGAWVPCDGRDVTGSRLHLLTGRANVADFRGRFPLGKDDSAVDRVRDTAADNLGGEGGEDRHTLTVGEMPSHTHSEAIGLSSGRDHYRPDVGGQAPSNEFHWGGRTSSEGGSAPHNNMPPFSVVVYYCRIN